MKHFLVFSLTIFFVGTISFVFGQEFENYNIEVITVAENLDVPWEIAFAPDGNLYLLTSNRDGRESPAENDDRILKIVPIISQEKIGDSSKAPLKQVREGILPTDVACKTGYELILKSTTGKPACVFAQTAPKLVSKGWGILP